MKSLGIVIKMYKDTVFINKKAHQVFSVADGRGVITMVTAMYKYIPGIFPISVRESREVVIGSDCEICWNEMKTCAIRTQLPY